MRALILTLSLLFVPALHAQEQTTWHLTNLNEIGGIKPAVEGHPTASAEGIHFNGKDDAVFFAAHPLAGATTWTWEMVFRPDPDGAPEQRVFHLQPVDADGKDMPQMRMLFEIRIRDVPGTTEKRWCLDSHARVSATPPGLITLLDCSAQKLHAFGAFHTATATYDGITLRSYVDGELQGEGPVRLTPQLPGYSSLGTGINRQYYFKGTVPEARFTRRVLPVREFLKAAP